MHQDGRLRGLGALAAVARALYGSYKHEAAGIAAAMEQFGTLRLDGLSGDYPYRPPDRRVPPRASAIFTVDPQDPLGLAALAVNLETDTSRRLAFP